MKTKLIILTLSILLAACAPATFISPLPGPTSPIAPPVREITPEPPAREITFEPIQIDRVEVRITDSLPIQVFAHVTGVIGDGCSSVLPVKQQRSGNTLTLTINRQRPTDAVCTQLAKIYGENIRLNGDFTAGEYVLNVNSVTQNFTVR